MFCFYSGPIRIWARSNPKFRTLFSHRLRYTLGKNLTSFDDSTHQNSFFSLLFLILRWAIFADSSNRRNIWSRNPLTLISSDSQIPQPINSNSPLSTSWDWPSRYYSRLFSQIKIPPSMTKSPLKDLCPRWALNTGERTSSNSKSNSTADLSSGSILRPLTTIWDYTQIYSR